MKFLKSTSFQDDSFEYSGFVNRTSSTLSFVDGTRVFTIAPNPNYDIYVGGNKIISPISTNFNITISNTIGVHFIYFTIVAGTVTINESTTAWNLKSAIATIATVYWDGTKGTIGDERHGLRSLAWHEWAHKTVKTRYESGLTATVTATTTSVTSGIIHDEDIIHTIALQSTVKIWYRNTGGATFKFDAASARMYKSSGGTEATPPMWDNAGTPTAAGASNYVVYWMYVSNDYNTPIYSFMGQQEYGTLTLARAATPVAPHISWPNIANNELKLLYKVIFRNSGGATTFTELNADYRNDTSGIGSVGGTVTSLPASAITYDDSVSLFNGGISTNVQAILPLVAPRANPVFTGAITNPTGSLGIGTTGTGTRKCIITTSDAGIDVALDVTIARTTGTNYAIYGAANGTGGTTNIGGFFTAGGAGANQGLRIYNVPVGANNYAIYSDAPAKSYIEGSVGIGSTGAITNAKLEVTGDITATTSIRVVDAASTAQRSVSVTNAGGTFYLGKESSIAGAFFTGSSAYASVVYSNNNIETICGGVKKTVVDSNGLIVIGNTADAIPALKIKGSSGTLVTYPYHSTTFGCFFQAVNTAENAVIPLTLSGSKIMLMDGNVGIGTSAPAVELAVYKSTAVPVRIHLQNSTTGLAGNNGLQLGISGAGEGYLWNYSNTHLKFGTANTERLTIESGGNLAIGAGTVAQCKLDFGVSVANQKLVIGTWMSGNYWTGIGMDTGTAGIRIAGDYATLLMDVGSYSNDVTHTWTSKMVVRGDTGNVGIGSTNPATKLELEETTNTSVVLSLSPYTSTIGKNYNWKLVANNASANYRFDIQNGNVATPYLTILNSTGSYAGFIGINSTSPKNQLQIGATKGIDADNIVYNAYYNGGWKFLTSNAANILGTYLGDFRFYTSVTGTADAACTMTEKMTILVNGNVGIGQATPSYKLEVNGSFAATTKSFVIPHPTKKGMKLRYASLEGDENGVYVRGKLKGTNVITLPDYWYKLVDIDSISVSLTPIGEHQKLYVKSINENEITIENENFLSAGINCFYIVYAERIDVPKLETEIYA